MSDELELRVAWERHLGRSSVAIGWFERVVAMHRAPDRHYHDLRHVQWVVRRVAALHDRVTADRTSDDNTSDATSDETGRWPADLPAIVAAAFFHDVIYEPTAPDNEARSADLARRALAEIGWASDRCDDVAHMILATAHHDPDTSDRATAILIAADLSVLAADPAGYSEYSGNVRKEYRHVRDSDWVIGRSHVLRTFLDRPTVFPTILQLDTWERRARANVTAEVAMLNRDGSRDGGAEPEP